jgi:hypothetical protein
VLRGRHSSDANLQNPALVFDRPDPYRSVARELLVLLAEEGRPMTLRALQARMSRDDAARQLSVARVAGFVRAAGSRRSEPAYAPTALGLRIARRAMAAATQAA